MQSTREPRENRVETRREVAIAVLLERAIDGMHQLAAEETSLVTEELESDARALARAGALGLGAGVCATASVTWAGVALALSVDSSVTGLAVLASVGALLGCAATLVALRVAPRVLLATSRPRVQARLERLRESLR